jgi:pyruvate,water dikinase
MEYILSFSQLNKSMILEAGGKGANLGELISSGFNVPSGFVLVTQAYDAFVEQNNLKANILKLIPTESTENIYKYEDASRQIRQLFLEANIPQKIREEVIESRAAIDEIGVAVRSSATTEDLPDASFAGQQSTFLNGQGVEGLFTAIKECWASLWTAQAIVYRKQQKNRFKLN